MDYRIPHRMVVQTMGVVCAMLLAAGCPSRRASQDTDAAATPSAAQPEPSASAEPADGSADATTHEPLVLIAGGDVDLSRGTGQKILRDRSYDPFEKIQSWLDRGDLRFVNLECQLSDQKGETESKYNHLVFTGPPQGAEVLKRARVDVVSTANNHAWDYGKRALVETVQNLDRVGIAHTGTDPEGKKPLRSVVVERKGYKVAFFAMTALFNDGPANLPEPRKHVASVNTPELARQIAEIRSQVDWVVVSMHIGQEYMNEPVTIHRSLLERAIDAGADIVLGHHPHVPQGVMFHHGKPIVVSMGNFVFHTHSDHAWTAWGYLARVTLVQGETAKVEACPYFSIASVPRPVTEAQERAFNAHFADISRAKGFGRMTSRSADGCWTIEPGQATK